MKYIQTQFLLSFPLLLLLASLLLVASAFPLIFSGRSPRLLRPRHHHHHHHRSLLFQYPSSLLTLYSSSLDGPHTLDGLRLEAVAASGFGLVVEDDTELSLVLQAVEAAFVQGLGLVVTCQTDHLVTTTALTNTSKDVVGALGRVLLLHTNLDDDSIEVLQSAIAEQIDGLLYAEPPSALRQPVLISIQNNNNENSNNLLFREKSSVEDVLLLLASLVQQEVDDYEMAKPLLLASKKNEEQRLLVQPPTIDASAFVPSLHVELDGAQTTDEYSSTSFWDTSSVLLFDNLVDDDLRKRLLDVTLGSDSKGWDDVSNGPNPNRWIRGGLSDVPDDEADTSEDSSDGPCWGLTAEAIDDICFGPHDAIEDFESLLSQLFPQFTVTRLPEAVFGASVSPLTANAPTAGDSFDYHIDGDPNQTPPSPWTDIYGRYPNRLSGKPRFMSCLLYLNDEWEAGWGAPTRFWDPPTEDYYEVLPRPGRCVLMDQDCCHTVVAPNGASAGTKRPRYSLVWKLILHPKTVDQDMTDLAIGRDWPEPLLFGSAQKQ